MSKLVQFLSESKAELKKVVWPKKDEVVKSTGVVIIVVAFISVFLFLTDMGVDNLLNLMWK